MDQFLTNHGSLIALFLVIVFCVYMNNKQHATWASWNTTLQGILDKAQGSNINHTVNVGGVATEPQPDNGGGAPGTVGAAT